MTLCLSLISAEQLLHVTDNYVQRSLTLANDQPSIVHKYGPDSSKERITYMFLLVIADCPNGFFKSRVLPRHVHICMCKSAIL
jgi:hypothetical protein